MLIKTCSKTMHRIYTIGSLLGRSLINSMHSPFTAPLIGLSCFSYLTAKEYFRLFEFLNGTLDLNIGTFKMFKQRFKIFKPEVLKAASFRRWNETVFQNFCNTYWLSKILFKNMSVLTHFEFCAFRFCSGCYSNVIVYFHHTFSA